MQKGYSSCYFKIFITFISDQKPQTDHKSYRKIPVIINGFVQFSDKLLAGVLLRGAYVRGGGIINEITVKNIRNRQTTRRTHFT